jgi:hypothetical protein
MPNPTYDILIKALTSEVERLDENEAEAFRTLVTSVINQAQTESDDKINNALVVELTMLHTGIKNLADRHVASVATTGTEPDSSSAVIIEAIQALSARLDDFQGEHSTGALSSDNSSTIIEAIEALPARINAEQGAHTGDDLSSENVSTILEAVKQLSARLDQLDEQDQEALDEGTKGFLSQIQQGNNEMVATLTNFIEDQSGNSLQEIGVLIEQLRTALTEAIRQFQLEIDATAGKNPNEVQTHQVLSQLLNATRANEPKLTMVVEAHAELKRSLTTLTEQLRTVQNLNAQLSNVLEVTVPAIVQTTVDQIMEGITTQIHSIYTTGISHAKMITHTDPETLPPVGKNLFDTPVKRIGAGIAALVLIVIALMLVFGGGGTPQTSTTTTATTPATQSASPAPAPAPAS